MSREIIRLYRKSGPLFTGQYLKQVSFLLQRYVGGQRTKHPVMKTSVSLTRSGIPRIIPPFYRKKIRNGNDPAVIQVVLSVCTLSRIMLVPPKGGLRINPATIYIKGFQLSEECKKLCARLVSSGFSFLKGYVPAYSDIPIRLGSRFRPTFSSGPNTYKDPRKESIIREGGLCGSSKMSVYHTLPLDATALMTLFKLKHLVTVGSMLFEDREIYPISGFHNPILPTEEGGFTAPKRQRINGRPQETYFLGQ